MLRIHLLTKNNQKTIEKCLQSIACFDAELVVADLGSTDSTLSICRKLNVKVKTVDVSKSFSEIRNSIMGPNWNLYLEPWELLISGFDEIQSILKDKTGAYRFSVFQGDMISKEIRLWHSSSKAMFENPVYESIYLPSAKNIDASIFSGNKRVYDDQRLDDWKKTDPLSDRPYYYQAFRHLELRQYDEFIKAAKHYLFQNQKGEQVIMLKYYLATVQLYVKNNTSESVRHVMQCIAVKPTMAEFWCLLGDIYYQRKAYSKAQAFYENAIVLGSRRKSDDNWPLEITKYKKYPTKMWESCKEIISESKVFVPKA